MHDAAYARDTFILDLEDLPSSPRVPTEELTMHVHLEGAWHRRTPDMSHSACELVIDGQRCALRREELAGQLCTRGCFTRFELALAAAANQKGFEP